MSWVALKMLVGDRAKFIGIVTGLTFTALLITQQGSIFCGLMLRTAAQITDVTGADLWVMDPSVRFADDVKPMLENNLYRVRGVSGVRWAVPLYKGLARAKLNTIAPGENEQTVIEQVILLGLDDATMVGAPPPAKILAGDLKQLRMPDAVLVDQVGLRKLFPGQGGEFADRSGLNKFLGREMEMNDHRAVIVGICETTRTFQSNPVVYTTYSRAKQYVPNERKTLSFVLAKTEPGLTSADVAGRIREQTSLAALTSDDFRWKTIEYYLKYTGIPVNFGITAMLGFLVGIAIAGQTFYNFTLENLRQFGALKAMGLTNARIVGMILLQAMVVGLLGYGLGVGAGALFGWHISTTELAFYIWWPILPITGLAVVAICVLSSLICIRRVAVLEPAVVFRS